MSGIRYGVIQLLKKMLATFVDVTFVVGIALVGWVCPCAMMAIDRLPAMVLGSGLKIPMATNWRGSVGGNNSNFL